MISVWPGSILLLAAVGAGSLLRGISNESESKLVLSVMGMMDADKDGVIDHPEVEDFLNYPGIPRAIRAAFSANTRRVVDFNHNGKLEKHEIRRLLRSALAGSQWPEAAAAQLVAMETEQMIDSGEITLPETPDEAGDALVSILDADDSGTISLDEAHAFYRVAVTEGFWPRVLKTAEAVDVNKDRELNRQEAAEWYLLTEEMYGPTSFQPLIIYGRIVATLGEYPSPSQQRSTRVTP